MSKPDPRIAPKEMIITRNKSAQQRRQLRDKDRSVVTKSPPQKKVKKKQRSPKKEKEGKRVDVSDGDERKDFYPEKLKRDFSEKKVFLKPKHKLKMVARTNKRKFNTPRKGVKSPILTKPSDCSPRSFTQLMDEDSLDDEGFMEILTCPSPVWWEAPPHDGYFEEPIGVRSPDVTRARSPTVDSCLKTETEDTTSLKETNLSPKHVPIDPQSFTNEDVIKRNEKNDERFVKKRRKLENVLGFIKNKTLAKDDVKTNEETTEESTFTSKEIVEQVTEPMEIVNDELVNKSLEVNKDSIEVKPQEGNLNVMEIKEQKKQTPKVKKLSESTEEDMADLNFRDEEGNLNVMEIKEQKKQTAKVKKLSESTEEDMADLNFRDEDMLLLENMSIPIKEGSIEKSSSSDSIVFLNDDKNDDDGTIYVIESNDDDKTNVPVIDDLICKDTDVNIKRELISEFSNENATNDANIKISENLEAKSSLIDDKSDVKSIVVPKNLPPLKKRPEFGSPVSKNVIEEAVESTSLSSFVSDSISDTNVKFIMDEDIDNSDLEVKTNKYEYENEEFVLLNETNDSNDAKSSKDYITVYKIMPNNKEKNKFKNIPEYSSYVENLKKVDAKEDTKGQLNNFYKKCKNAYKKRCKKQENLNSSLDNKDSSLCESCEPKKCITVAQDENVKYCLKCSSIFDTDECSYCLKSENETPTSKNCA